MKLTKNGFYIQKFRKSADGYHWGYCEITSWNPFKLFDFVKNGTYKHEQNLFSVKTAYQGKFQRPKETGFVARDISMFVDNLKGIDTEEFLKLTEDMAVYISEQVNINNRPSAFYRFIIQETDKKKIKDKIKALTNMFELKGAEIR